MIRYSFTIRTRTGQRIDNVSIIAGSQKDAERRLRQMYLHCDILECREAAIPQEPGRDGHGQRHRPVRRQPADDHPALSFAPPPARPRRPAGILRRSPACSVAPGRAHRPLAYHRFLPRFPPFDGRSPQRRNPRRRPGQAHALGAAQGPASARGPPARRPCPDRRARRSPARDRHRHRAWRRRRRDGARRARPALRAPGPAARHRRRDAHRASRRCPPTA